MKRVFSVLLLLIFPILLLSQGLGPFTQREVISVPVFPGCEYIPIDDKVELTSCMREKISSILSEKLDLEDILISEGIYNAAARIQFVVSKEGKIISVEALKGGNPILGDASVEIIKDISSTLPLMIPGKLENGEPVNMVFQLPVTYTVDLEEEVVYPSDEIVLFTLLSEEEPNLRYEVRFFKMKDIKVYEIADNKATYLGKFLSLNEVEESEPYRSLIQKSKKEGKVLVADGMIDNEFYEVYIHNLLKKKQNKSIFVEIVRVKNDKRRTVEKYEREDDFNKSRYAPLIYRD